MLNNQFKKNSHVRDIRVIDMLVIQVYGKNTFIKNKTRREEGRGLKEEVKEDDIYLYLRHLNNSYIFLERQTDRHCDS